MKLQFCFLAFSFPAATSDNRAAPAARLASCAAPPAPLQESSAIPAIRGQGKDREREETRPRGGGERRRRQRRQKKNAATALAIAVSNLPAFHLPSLSPLPKRNTTSTTETHLILSAGLLLEQVLAPGVAAGGRAAADLDLGDAPREERAKGDGQQGHDGGQRGGEAVVHDRVGHPVGGMGVGVGVTVGRRTLEQICYCIHQKCD